MMKAPKVSVFDENAQTPPLARVMLALTMLEGGLFASSTRTSPRTSV